MEENSRVQGAEDQITEVSLLDLLIIIAKHKKLLIITVLLFAILGSVYSFTRSKSTEQNLQVEQTPRFASTMKIMPLTPNTLRTGYFDTKASIFIANLLKSDIVLDKVLQDDGLLPDASDIALLRQKRSLLSDDIETLVNDNTGVISVDIASDTQEHAQKLAGYLLKSANYVVSDMWKQVDAQRKNIIKDQIAESLSTVKNFKSVLIKGKVTNNAEFNSFLDSQLTYWAFQQNQAYKNQDVLILYLVSPIANVPSEDMKMDGTAVVDNGNNNSRVKTTLMFVILGVFVGLTLVFLRHFWQL